MGGISIWQLLIVLVVVLLLFGTKRLRTLGGDLGSALKGFRDSMQDGQPQTVDKDNHLNTEHSAGDDKKKSNDNTSPK